MFIAPRPLYEDDPNYAVRLALAPIAGFVIGLMFRSPMAVIYPTLFFGLMAGSRHAFDLRRTIAAPIAFSVMLWFMSGMVTLLIGLPMLLVLFLGLIFFVGFYLILKTGNPMGMLIIVSAVMMSVLGTSSYISMIVLRDEMSKAAIMTAVVVPVLYAILPPRTNAIVQDVYEPSVDTQLVLRALIRTFVLMLACVGLYSVIDTSNMMLAVVALFVLTFPTKERLFAESIERSYATVLGGAIGLAIMAVITTSGHLFMVLGVSYLACLYLADKMMNGRHPPMVYQYAASVMLSLVGGAVASQEPSYAFITRVGLTLAGALAAAFLTSLLETLLLREEPQKLAA